jgi:eukaryotic-like serine/threonine-protein kinase
MALAPGARLGPYEIQSAIGAGGMGEVYKARDTRLDRTVAVKILPAALAADPQFRERFDREARAISQLTHPHICTLHDVGEADAVRFLVMELLEGETLASRLEKGALPPPQALTIAIEIASALDAAHRAGIVHRDLKPGNVVLTKTGAKLLDFGLARTNAPVVALSGTMAPTTPPSITAQGTILGTFQYMAPEQIEGIEADARTDIFAFGCVLFEMLTGKKAFEGKTRASLIGAILKDEPPPVSQITPLAPASLNRIVATCLAKEPDDRWQTARDLMRELKWVAEGGVSLDSGARSVFPVAPRSVWSRALPWAIAGTMGVASIASLLLWAPWQSGPAPTPRKLLASIGADASLPTDVGASAILTPDGTTLAFVAQQAGQTRLFVRKLDQLQAAALAGTEGAASPFFSPDGQWIAFFAGGKLKKISVTGGAAVNLCDAPTGRGGTWTGDDTIIFAPANTNNVTLMRVPAAGGTPAVFGRLSKGGTTQRWPQALPRGVGVLYTENSSTGNWDAANIAVAPLSGGTPKVVVRGGHYGRYVPSGLGSPTRAEREGGHITYLQQGTLFAVRFDLDRLETRGQAVPALEGISASPGITGGAQLAVSSEGTLVYVPGTVATTANPIDWMTRDGKTSVLRATKADWANPRFSPDGQKLALEISDGRQRDIWVYEWARDTLTQLTFDPGQDVQPIWTPDGRRIVFSSDRAKSGVGNLYWVNADGTGEVTRLTDSSENQAPSSWHPSGKFLAFMSLRGAGDLMILPMEGDAARGWTPGKPTVFLSTPATEALPMFSPDGRWIAYFSTEAGGAGLDVYVRPFPGPGGKWRVSMEGGIYPRWSTTTHELLFLNPSLNLKVMFAPYAVVGDSFRADKPQTWSPTSVLGARVGNSAYDLHPDGKRIAALPAQDQGSASQDKIVFVFHFSEYLQKIAPGARR